MNTITYRYTSNSESLATAIKNNNIAAIAQLSLTLADLEQVDADGQTALKRAFLLKQQDILNQFYRIAEKAYASSPSKADAKGGTLEAYTEKNKADAKGRTLVHWAVKCNLGIDEFSELKKQGYDLNFNDEPFYATPLYVAAQEGKTKSITALLELGADANIPVINGGTVLHAACEFCDVEAVAAIIEAKADINAYFQHAGTPLCIAAQLGREEIVRKLLAASADPRIGTSAGKKPYDLAKEYKHEAIAELFT